MIQLNNVEQDCQKLVSVDLETAVDEKTVVSVNFISAAHCKDGTNGLKLQLDCSKNFISINQEPNVCEQEEINTVTEPKKYTENALAAPDGGWGWVIVGCAFCITAIVGGSYTAFSLLYMEFTLVFNTSKAVAGWIGSIYMATGQFLGIFFTYAVQRYGSRIVCITGSVVACVGLIISSFVTSVIQLYIFYGLIAGSGVGMIVLSSLVLVQQYFNRRRAMAAGIAVSGYSFGSLVAGPLVRILIDSYAWRGTLMLIAGIFLQVSVLAMLFRPLFIRKNNSSLPVKMNGVQETSILKDKDIDTGTVEVDAKGSQRCMSFTRICALCREICSSSFNFSLLRNYSFCVYLVSVFLVHVGMTTFLQHTPSRAAHYGVQRNLVALLPTITGISVGISRIIFGFVANAPRFVDRMLQYGVTAMLSGAVQMTTALATTFETMALYCVIQGICNGGFLAILTTILVDLNGVENIARSISIWSLFVGASMLLSLPFAGFLYDMTLNYNIPFISTGLFQAIGGIMGIIIFLVKRCR